VTLLERAYQVRTLDVEILDYEKTIARISETRNRSITASGSGPSSSTWGIHGQRGVRSGIGERVHRRCSPGRATGVRRRSTPHGK